MKQLVFTQEIKSKWLEALKSGDYIQGKRSLRKTRKDGAVCHCCLGVLAEIHPALTINEHTDDDVYLNGENMGYDAFNKILYSTNVHWRALAWQNDEDNDYSNVIPLIEALPTTDL